MEFLVFQRADSALLVVPALFQPPLACQRQGPVRVIGRCEVDLERFSEAVATGLAQDGYASIAGADLAVLRAQLERVPASAAAPPPDPREVPA
jgi:hypothetical protein